MDPAHGEDVVILLGHARDIGPLASANSVSNGFLGGIAEWRQAGQTLVHHHAKRKLVGVPVVFTAFIQLGSL
jgi:hypothetical protein